MARVGFEVGEWKSKPFSEFTNEELLEYWHKLRLTCKSGEINLKEGSVADTSTRLYIADLQQEILERMGNK